MVSRNIRIEQDLVAHFFDTSEKRLARVLSMLATFGEQGKAESVVPEISQVMLARMVGTTRSRISFFMNRFRKLGFINPSSKSRGQVRVNSSLLRFVQD
jgi:CRP/FNR family cyclic AMP-dependent transcriptional regulator